MDISRHLNYLSARKIKKVFNNSSIILNYISDSTGLHSQAFTYSSYVTFKSRLLLQKTCFFFV